MHCAGENRLLSLLHGRYRLRDRPAHIMWVCACVVIQASLIARLLPSPSPPPPCSSACTPQDPTHPEDLQCVCQPNFAGPSCSIPVTRVEKSQTDFSAEPLPLAMPGQSWTYFYVEVCVCGGGGIGVGAGGRGCECEWA